MANLVHHVAGVCNALDGEAGVRPSVDGGAGLARQLQQALPGGGQAPALLGRKLDEVVALPARAAVLHASQRLHQAGAQHHLPHVRLAVAHLLVGSLVERMRKFEAISN